jgi:ketosteroid isomerase-like protein
VVVGVTLVAGWPVVPGDPLVVGWPVAFGPVGGPLCIGCPPHALATSTTMSETTAPLARAMGRTLQKEPRVELDEVRMTVLKEVTAAFDRHDLDGIMAHFVDDCVFMSPRGGEAWGRRIEGREAVRAAFADRFAGIPDVRYTDDSHFVAGDRGLSEWLLSGTTAEGQRIEVRGCDIWTFRGDKIAVKNSFWKIRL